MGGRAEFDDSKRPSDGHDEGRPSSDDVNAHAPRENKPDDLGRLAPSHVLDAIGKARDEFAARHGTAAGAIAGVAAAEIVSAIKAAWGELSGESDSAAMATAAASFRLHRDYPSLARLLPWLTPGTSAVRLLALLGPVVGTRVRGISDDGTYLHLEVELADDESLPRWLNVRRAGFGGAEDVISFGIEPEPDVPPDKAPELRTVRARTKVSDVRAAEETMDKDKAVLDLLRQDSWLTVESEFDFAFERPWKGPLDRRLVWRMAERSSFTAFLLKGRLQAYIYDAGTKGLGNYPAGDKWLGDLGLVPFERMIEGW